MEVEKQKEFLHNVVDTKPSMLRGESQATRNAACVKTDLKAATNYVTCIIFFCIPSFCHWLRKSNKYISTRVPHDMHACIDYIQSHIAETSHYYCT